VSAAAIPGAGTGTLHLAMGGATSYVSVGDAVGLPPELPEAPPVAGVEPAPSPAGREGSGPTAPTIGDTGPAAAPFFGLAPARSSAGVAGSGASSYGPASNGPADAAGTAPAAAVSEAAPVPAQQQLAVAPSQFLVSPKDFDGTSLLALALAAGGLVAVGMVVLTRRMRKVAKWGA
jgi:hypothetical protein